MKLNLSTDERMENTGKMVTTDDAVPGGDLVIIPVLTVSLLLRCYYPTADGVTTADSLINQLLMVLLPDC